MRDIRQTMEMNNGRWRILENIFLLGRRQWQHLMCSWHRKLNSIFVCACACEWQRHQGWRGRRTCESAACVGSWLLNSGNVLALNANMFEITKFMNEVGVGEQKSANSSHKPSIRSHQLNVCKTVLRLLWIYWVHWFRCYHLIWQPGIQKQRICEVGEQGFIVLTINWMYLPALK